jgi:hypothetical protein
MKRTQFIIAFFVFCAFTAMAAGKQDAQSFSTTAYYSAIGQNLNHSLDKNELDVADSTYLWYQKKWDGKWDRSRFDYAVEKGTANCKNQAMLAAAKTGEFGKKVLKALVVSAGDAAEAFSDWLNKNSARYDQKNGVK